MATSVYVLRHGKADPGGPDAERPLTQAGRSDIQSLGRVIARLGAPIGRVRTSPLVRAQQTADILSEAAGLPPPEVAPPLRSGASPAQAFECIEVEDEGGCVLVGHMPDVAGLVGYCITGHGQRLVDFSAGAMVRIDFLGQPRPGAGFMRWAIQPDQLRALLGD